MNFRTSLSKLKNNFISAFKKETVLCIALLLAVVSACFVHPDTEYVGYVDFRTLGILFCLMAVMSGLRAIGVFDFVAQKMLQKTKQAWQVVLVLLILTFFSSMIITNDVALITFVPFTIIVLGLMGDKVRGKFLIPVVAMQTVAANLGSMLTPIGNPQNLYLYGQSDLSLSDFVMLMLPYSTLALLLLVVWGIVFGRTEKGNVDFHEITPVREKKKILLYSLLFVASLLTVADVISVWIPFVAVIVLLFIFDRSILLKIDYALLGTFVGFFVFIGNMGRVSAFSDMLNRMIAGHEVATSVLASQVVSNVPAALLLSGFTDKYQALIIGTNLGGLGTLIASMASLISFKYIAREDRSLRGKYLIYFTIVNILFLGAMMVLYKMI